MIEKLIELSIRNRYLVMAVAAALAVASICAVFNTPVDAIPDLSENQVIVFTDWMGCSPKEIEDQVTYPLSLKLQGLAGVKTVRSTSEFNYSMITIIFEDQVGFYFARERVLEKLTKVLQETAPESREQNASGRAAWWNQIRAWKAEHPLTPEVSTTEIKPQHVMREIDRLYGGSAIVTSDVGQHQMWAAQFIRFNSPRLWINSGGLGSMGFGLPSAIGAQFARPDKLVFSIVGDGGFQMSIPELATIANHALPIKIIVVNNGHLGMVRQWQELFYNNRLSQVELNSFPDAEKLAGAYGFKGRTIEGISWRRRLKKRFASRAPTC